MKGSIKYGLLVVNALLIVSMIVFGGLARGAALTVPTMFSNDAVLQRGMVVPVFGTAAAGAQD